MPVFFQSVTYVIFWIYNICLVNLIGLISNLRCMLAFFQNIQIIKGPFLLYVYWKKSWFLMARDFWEGGLFEGAGGVNVDYF